VPGQRVQFVDQLEGHTTNESRTKKKNKKDQKETHLSALKFKQVHGVVGANKHVSNLGRKQKSGEIEGQSNLALSFILEILQGNHIAGIKDSDAST
jgi:hypothetical protein